MKFLLLVSLAIAAVSAQSDEEICPKKEDMAPCSCDREGFSCLNAKTEEDVKKAFRAPNRQKATRGFWLNGTPIKNITKDMFNGYKVQSFHFEFNQIEEIEEGAFDGSEKTMSVLSFDVNKVKSIPFNYLRNFPLLSVFSARRNQFSAIPENAFRGLNQMQKISFDSNNITRIAPSAFFGPQNLQFVILNNNSLSQLGPNALSMNQSFGILVLLANNRISNISRSAFNDFHPAMLDLSYNNLTYLDQEVFVPFLHSMVNVASQQRRRPGAILTKGNPFTCNGCEKYKWMVENKNLANSFFPDFHCADGRPIDALTLSNIGCSWWGRR